MTMPIETRLPAHWHDLSSADLIQEAARSYYGQLPDAENLAEPPEGADFWTLEDALDYMWSADTALRMLADLPNSRRALQKLLSTAKVKYEECKGEIWFRKTWIFPDGTTLEMEALRQAGPLAYSTGYYPENIVTTHERF